MAAKKKTAKKTSKKKAVKKKSVKKRRKSSPGVKKSSPKPVARKIRATRTRINLVVKNLILFIVLTLISYILYAVSTNELFDSFFYLLSMILGFVSLAFLISLLVLLILKAMRR